ncbi:DUF4811 domain-containing protein [Pediococcus damnosus]|uniref:DUF4811 domain-containing protein n=1 Tax=Pediococcus damnosus TaxID=51663 RepID=UPI000C1CAFB0|nr:DUF4811 domain-containing protein [Pediococcus damnosus]PIO84815.1 hypothetical protein BSQ37_02225 [Pediococcus damnosus]
MIVILLIAGALIFAISMIFIRPGVKKLVWVFIGLILSVGSVVALTLNYNTFLGMKEVSKTQTYPLTSSVHGQHVLSYQQLGTKNERVYFYATNPLQQKLAKTDPSTGSVKIKHNSKMNQVKITRVTRVYRSEEMKLLFSNGVPNHQFVSQNYEFRLMSGWKLKQVTTQGKKG